MLRLGDDRGVRRSAEPRRLRQPDPHAARARYPRRLRSAAVRKRQGEGVGAPEEAPRWKGSGRTGMKRLMVVGLALALASPSFADTADDLKALMARYAAAFNKGDAAALARDFYKLPN